MTVRDPENGNSIFLVDPVKGANIRQPRLPLCLRGPTSVSSTDVNSRIESCINLVSRVLSLLHAYIFCLISTSQHHYSECPAFPVKFDKCRRDEIAQQKVLLFLVTSVGLVNNFYLT